MTPETPAPKSKPRSEWMTLQEVLVAFGYSPTSRAKFSDRKNNETGEITHKGWVKDGLLPPPHIIGGRNKWPRDVIDALVKARREFGESAQRYVAFEIAEGRADGRGDICPMWPLEYVRDNADFFTKAAVEREQAQAEKRHEAAMVGVEARRYQRKQAKGNNSGQ